jgi:hypothetical protein
MTTLLGILGFYRSLRVSCGLHIYVLQSHRVIVLRYLYVSSNPWYCNGCSKDPDWAIYEAFKTASIPNYKPYRPAEKKGPASKTKTEEDVQELELAARYAVTSASAMAISAILTNPLEVVRTRWQTSGGDIDRPKTLVFMVRDMWRQAGWRAFMRGALIRGLYYVRDYCLCVAYSLLITQIPANVRIFSIVGLR